MGHVFDVRKEYSTTMDGAAVLHDSGTILILELQSREPMARHPETRLCGLEISYK